MALSVHARSHLQIHFCVLLWGFTAILGKLITLPALPLVWWRMLLVVATLALLPSIWRGIGRMSGRDRLIFVGIGCLVALHWLTFYSAIKLANASVGAICIATAPVFLALIEPAVVGRRFQPRELLVAVGVIPGVVLVVGGIPADMYVGLVVGIVSAAFVAVFSACNKRVVERGDPLTITAIELGAGTVLLTLLAPLLPHDGPAFPLPGMHDALLLLVLALACTLLPFAIILRALRHVSAFATQMATNLEPVYAVILAIVLLDEQQQVTWIFYLGVIIIVASVVALPLLRPGPPDVPPAEVLATSESVNLTE